MLLRFHKTFSELRREGIQSLTKMLGFKRVQVLDTVQRSTLIRFILGPFYLTSNQSFKTINKTLQLMVIVQNIACDWYIAV